MVRLGMLTPSSNTVLEPTTARMVAAVDGATVHFSRFTVTEIALDDQALAQFDPAPMLNAANLLSHAKADVISWNGTSASWLGLDTDRALVGRIKAETGIRASTCVLSMMEALKALDAHSYGLVTPYTTDVQDRIVDNLSGHGLVCTAERHFNIRENFAFGTVEPERVADAVRTVAGEGPDAVVILCTNLAGAENAAAIERETGVPVLDSVTLTVWGALRAAGRSTTALAPWGPRLSDLNPSERLQ